MEALTVTFELVDPSVDIDGMLASHDTSMCELPGYVEHIWLRSGTDLKLLVIFEDRPALAAYLISHLPSALMAHPSWRAGFDLAHHLVIPDERRGRQPDEVAAFHLAPTRIDAATLTRRTSLGVEDRPPLAMRPSWLSCAPTCPHQDAATRQPARRS